MPTSARRYKPISRKSTANSQHFHGAMWASPPTHDLKSASVLHLLQKPDICPTKLVQRIRPQEPGRDLRRIPRLELGVRQIRRDNRGLSGKEPAVDNLIEGRHRNCVVISVPRSSMIKRSVSMYSPVSAPSSFRRNFSVSKSEKSFQPIRSKQSTLYPPPRGRYSRRETSCQGPLRP